MQWDLQKTEFYLRIQIILSGTGFQMSWDCRIESGKLSYFQNTGEMKKQLR